MAKVFGRKMFDRVWHEGLLFKLLTSWSLENLQYNKLISQKQVPRVVLNSQQLSKWSPVKVVHLGVPQKSIPKYQDHCFS